MIESRQSYCKESRVQFFWPTLYMYGRVYTIHMQTKAPVTKKLVKLTVYLWGFGNDTEQHIDAEILTHLLVHANMNNISNNNNYNDVGLCIRSHHYKFIIVVIIIIIIISHHSRRHTIVSQFRSTFFKFVIKQLWAPDSTFAAISVD